MAVLKLNHSMMLVGPSNCGKSVFVTKLIKNKDKLFDKSIKRVIWCYSEMKPNIKNVIFNEGLPNTENLKEGDLLILDDLAFDADKNTTNLFTRISHNRKIFTIFVTQNMFASGNRTRSLNTHYFVIFRNPRDIKQISYLSNQMGKPFLIDVFNDLTHDNPFSYLVIDLTSTTSDKNRIFTGIFSNEISKRFISKTEFNLKDEYKSLLNSENSLSLPRLRMIEKYKQDISKLLSSNSINNIEKLEDVIIKERHDKYFVL